MAETPISNLEADVEACIDVGSVAYIEGPPGCGKTKFAGALAKRRGGYFACLLGSISDPTDLCGFPVVVNDSGEVDAFGHKLPSLRFAPREMFIRLNREGGILFLDELTCCSHAVQAAMLTAICDWRFGDYQLDRRKVGIIAAGNPADIAVNGQELAGPMQNRLEHFVFPTDNNARYEWCEQFPGYWGDPPQVGFNGKLLSSGSLLRARSFVAGFIRKKPSHWLDARFDEGQKAKKGDHTSPAWASPRSWERVANHLAHAIHHDRSPISAARRISAAIGPGIGTEFLTYLRETSLPDPEALLAHPDKYTPTGRLDVDFSTVMSVVAAFESKVTGPRYIASWKICRSAVSDKGQGGAAYEAGMAAATKLAEYVRGKKTKVLMDTLDKNDKQQMVELAVETNKLSKPFLGLIKQAAGELTA